MAVICWFGVQDSIWVGRMFSPPCHIIKMSWTFAIVCNDLSSGFLFISKSFSVFLVSKSRSAPANILLLTSRKLPNNNIFTKRLTWGFQPPPADNISARGHTGFYSTTMWHDREYVPCHIREIGIHCGRFLLLTPPVGYVRDPKWTANLHWIGVVIVGVWIKLPPALWCFRWRIQIGTGGGESVFCAIALSGCHLCDIVRH
jgi:hypothetical protein